MDFVDCAVIVQTLRFGQMLMGFDADFVWWYHAWLDNCGSR